MSETIYSTISHDASAALRELIAAADLKAGQLLVIGCSSSEMVGERIGKHSSMEAALALRDAVLPILNEHGICLAVQCCEHLNRALIVERTTAEKYGYNVVMKYPIPEDAVTNTAYEDWFGDLTDRVTAKLFHNKCAPYMEKVAVSNEVFKALPSMKQVGTNYDY